MLLLKKITNHWKIIALLAFLVFVTYANSLGNAYVSDDIAAFVENPYFGQWSLVFSSQLPFFNFFNFFRVIVSIFGNVPFLFRLINIFFHLGSTIAVYFLVSKLHNKKTGLIASCLFAVHPILSESIVWISGIPYSQSTFFLLLSFYFYLNAIGKEFNKKIYTISVFLFLLTMFSSEKALIFPIILFVYEICLGNIKKNWQKLIPFFLISGFWIINLLGLINLRISSIQPSVMTKPQNYNSFLQVPIAITSYLQIIFWPKTLTLYHSEMFFSTVEFYIRTFLMVLYLGLIPFIFFFRKNNRIISFWLSFFFISFIPTLTPFGISWIVAERYAYLGTIAILTLIALFLKKIGDIFKNVKITYILLIIIVTLLAARTIVRNKDWKNQDTMWLAMEKTSPSSPANHNNLGDLYYRRGDYQKAIEEFKTAISLLPQYADAHHNLANVYLKLNDLNSALIYYQKAVQFNPSLWQSRLNLGYIYYSQGKNEMAKNEAENSIKIYSNEARTHLLLGAIYFDEKNNVKAKEEFITVLKLDPENQQAIQILNSINNQPPR